MRISLKALAIAWIVLLIGISALLYNTYSKFQPETFIALLTEQVQKNYPGATLDVGKVSYRFSLDFNMKLKDVLLRRSGKILGSIGSLELKVPWWLLLVKRGNAQINISRLDIYVDHFEYDSSTESKSLPENLKNIKVEVPKYLAEAKFTLRAKSVSIRDIKNSRRFFTVSKLLVREFQYGKNSAFEINIPIEIKHNKTQYLSNLWLFGDVTPEPSEWKLNYHGEFRTRDNSDKFQMEDIVIKGTSSFAPSSFAIRSNISLFDEKELIGEGSFTAGQDNMAMNLAFSKLPLNYFGFIYNVIQNPYLSKLEGYATGKIEFLKNFDSSIAKMNGKLQFPGELFLKENSSIPGKWQVNFQNNKWELSFMSPKGEASFFRRSFLDLNKNIVTQYNEELGFTGLDMNVVLAAVKPLALVSAQSPNPYYSTLISYKECLQNEELINGNFTYGSSPGDIYYTAELKGGDSSFLLKYSNKNSQNFLDINSKQFNWFSGYSFLMPYFTSDAGKLDGKLKGRWTEDWHSGKWIMKLTGAELLEDKGIIPELIRKTLNVFEIKDLTSNRKVLNSTLQNNVLKINSLEIFGAETVKISGALSSKSKSTLTLSYPKKKKLKPYKKEVLEPYWMLKEEI